MDSATLSTWPTLARQLKIPETPTGVDALWGRMGGLVKRMRTRTRRFLANAEKVLTLGEEWANCSDAKLREQALTYRELFRLRRDTLADQLKAVALVREVAHRVRGEKPYREQVAGALAMLAGCVAEMATGEGKTLTASLTATLQGWRGRGCHVVTVNDYLAERDAGLMEGIYGFCGLTVGFLTQETEPSQRKAAYQADITYLTNKDATADFLRDRLAVGPNSGLTENLLDGLFGRRGGGQGVVQRGLAYAIIDEADSILIDEAVTPLIISSQGPNPEQAEVYHQACELSEKFKPKEDYQANARYQEVELTRRGRNKLNEQIKSMHGVWSGVRRAEELLVQALTAREFYVEGKQYIVQEDKVVIVDESTGRLMPDREWRDGLHQAVTAKEKLEVEPPKDTCARISFQRFFQLYGRLAGMTGTAQEARTEFWDIYRLPVAPIPTHRPCQRRRRPTEIYTNHKQKCRAIVEDIRRTHEAGQPVLVGTRSVKASVEISELLSEAGLEHQVLNAAYHDIEAQIVAQAGQEGKITVATNMAGRGTDIKLARGVAEAGGLHVVLTERHESKRVDRQLQGRCARQGDPGTIRDVIAIDDELLIRHGWLGRWLLKLMPGLKKQGRLSPLATRLAKLVFKLAQKKAGRKALAQRKSVLKSDTWLDEFLGFSGKEL